MSQYMSLLQGTSAFSFKPGGAAIPVDDDPEDESLKLRKISRSDGEMSEGKSAMGEFGGDYGDYLRLLEGNSALGFNPQEDPIAENQVCYSLSPSKPFVYD